MTLDGIITGAATFLIIGVFHPIVIKMEYHWGKRSWWALAVAGVAFASASIFMEKEILSTVFGAAAFSCFWGIYELIEQEERVLKGWFPAKPGREAYYEAKRKAKDKL